MPGKKRTKNNYNESIIKNHTGKESYQYYYNNNGIKNRARK